MLQRLHDDDDSDARGRNGKPSSKWDFVTHVFCSVLTSIVLQDAGQLVKHFFAVWVK